MLSNLKALQHLGVLVLPGKRRELGSDDRVRGGGHLRRLVDIVDRQLNIVHHVVQVEHGLRVLKRHEGPGCVDVVEAGFEDAHHAHRLEGRLYAPAA